MRSEDGTRMLSAKAAPVSLRSSVQWQRNLRIGSLVKEMRLRPQRQEDCVITGEMDKVGWIFMGRWMKICGLVYR